MVERNIIQDARLMPRFPEPETEPFWKATLEHELRYQVCNRCEKVVFYPRSHCTHCTSLELSWKTSAGVGTVYTYTVVRRSQHPAFKANLPYAIAWVDLDEGFRILTNIVGIDDPGRDVQIGQRVTVEWLDYESVSLPAFRPL